MKPTGLPSQFKFQLFSDIHLEFLPPGDTFDTGAHLGLAENIALLGDIGVCSDERLPQLAKFLRNCCACYKRVFFCQGNHEGYSQKKLTVDDVTARLKALSKSGPEMSNLYVLDNDAVDIEGTDVRVLGCTLWTKCKPPARHVLNDFNQIRNLYVDDIWAMHDKSVAFLQRELERAADESKRVAVFTHHAPIKKAEAIHPAAYEMEDQFGICGSDLVPTVFSADKFPALKLWCFGHTHWNATSDPDGFVRGGIRFVTNQVGYSNDNTKTMPEYVPADVKKVVTL